MWRVLSDKLHLNPIRAGAGETDSSRARRALEVGEGFLVADDARRQAVMFVRLAIILPVDAEIQRQIGTEFPIILEVRAHLALEIPVPVISDDGGTDQRGVLGTHHAEGLIDRSDRTGEVVQEVARGRRGVGGHVWKRCAIDSRDREAGGAAQGNQWSVIGIVKPVGFVPAPFVAHLEGVLADRPAQIIANTLQRIDSLSPPAKPANVAETLQTRIQPPTRRSRKRNLVWDAIRRRVKLSRLGASRVTAVCRSPLPVVRSPLSEPELIQQIRCQR